MHRYFAIIDAGITFDRIIEKSNFLLNPIWQLKANDTEILMNTGRNQLYLADPTMIASPADGNEFMAKSESLPRHVQTND